MDSTQPSPSLRLDRVVTHDALRWAWMRVRENGGAAGPDRVSLKRFALDLDQNLLDLADDVRAGTYRPGGARFVTMHGPGKIRRLAILPVRDRVLQRATLDLLMPIVDPMFFAHSYGYRPNRSLHDAVSRIVFLRNRVLTTVIDADIRRCFDTLDHDLIHDTLHDLVPKLDPTIWRLIDAWIATPASRHTPNVRRPMGVLQGAPISPLLCNVLLHRFDQSLVRRRLALVRYADDFVVLCRSPEQGERAMRTIEKCLAGVRLALNPAKTRLTSFDEGFTFLGVGFQGDDLRYHVGATRVVSVQVPPAEVWHGPAGYDDW